MTRSADLRAIDSAIVALTRVAHSQRARRRIEERSGVAIGPTGMSVLAAVHAFGKARHGAIARRLGVQPSRMSKEIRPLLDAGYIAERPDPDDRRAMLLELTPAGLEAYRRYRRATDDALAEVLGDWRDKDVTQLAALLTRLADAFTTARAD